MGQNVGSNQLDYPDVMERRGNLYIAFAGSKASVNLLRIEPCELGDIATPVSVESRSALRTTSSPKAIAPRESCVFARTTGPTSKFHAMKT
jgi:hypothetical protein